MNTCGIGLFFYNTAKNVGTLGTITISGLETYRIEYRLFTTRMLLMLLIMSAVLQSSVYLNLTGK